MKHSYVLLFLFAVGFFVNFRKTSAQDVTNEKPIASLDLKPLLDRLYEKQGKCNSSAQSELIDLGQETEELMDTYRKITNNAFRWAVRGKDSFSTITRNKSRFSNKVLIIKFTEKAMTNGTSTLGEVIEDYKKVQESFGQTKIKSETIKAKLQAEQKDIIDQFDEYERNRTQFNAEIPRRREEARKKYMECMESKKPTTTETPQQPEVPQQPQQPQEPKKPAEPEIYPCQAEADELDKAEKLVEMPSKGEERRKFSEVYVPLLSALDNFINGIEAFRAAIEDEITHVDELKAQTTDPLYTSSESTTEQIVDYLEKLVSKLSEYIRTHGA